MIDHANELLGSVNAAAAQELGHQVYLGPLRTIPESEILQAHHTASGTALWEQLALDPRALDKVNEWLTRLTDREFGPQLVVEVEGDDLWLKKPQRNELRDALLLVAKQFLAMERRSTGTGEKRASALAAFQVEDLASRWADHICNSARQSLRIQLRVTTAGTQAPLPPSHVGLGISQIVPLLAAGAGTRDHLLLVEQPELHLHPAMQAELADFMIETALGSQCNTWVLESHSEHLLLRLMRRIRETTRGTLKEGAPALRPEDVSLCFVERESGVSRVYPIELDENGMLTRPWPGGFFEEGFREVMAW